MKADEREEFKARLSDLMEDFGLTLLRVQWTEDIAKGTPTLVVKAGELLAVQSKLPLAVEQ
jgi:hypothetical protein